MKEVGDSLVRETATAWSRGHASERVFDPYFLHELGSDFIRVALYPIFARRWYPSARRFLSELREYEFAPVEKLKAAQWSKLSSLIQHASQNVPYYRELFCQLGVEPRDIRSFDDYRRIPILTKANVQVRLNDLIAQNRRTEEGLKNASGGSTGKPVQFYQDVNYWAHAIASERLIESWWGIRPGDRTASIWGTDRDIPEQTWRDRLYGLISQTRVCNAFALSEPQMKEFAEMLDAWQPLHITGYASALEVFARYLLDHPSWRIRPRAIRSTADGLNEDRRWVIEKAFSCPVYNFYGSREINNLATECPARAGLHVNALFRYIEIVDRAGKPAPPGQPGRILLTDLTNYFMPFLRYEIEDVGSWSANPCPCRRSFPVLEKIWGRASDFVVTPEGKLIHSVFFTHLFYDIPEVSTFQVVQKTLPEICVSIVLRPGEREFPSELLRARLRKALGPVVRFEVQTVTEIERPPSGKHRFVISHVSAPWGTSRLSL